MWMEGRRGFSKRRTEREEEEVKIKVSRIREMLNKVSAWMSRSTSESLSTPCPADLARDTGVNSDSDGVKPHFEV